MARITAAQGRSGAEQGVPCKTVGSASVGSNPHLPPHIMPAQAVCGQITAAGCWGCEPIRPGARASSGGVVFGQVRALRPDPAGICAPGVLLGEVDWWLSPSRAAAVTGEAGRWPLRWPAGSLGYAAGTWTPGGAGFSTAPLTVPGRLGQASVRPSPPPEAAQRPVPGWHDARRRLPRGPSRGNRCRARRLGPGKHCEREADRDIRPWQVFQSGPPEKQRDAFIARGRHIRSASSSCTTVTSAPVARHGLQLKLRSKRTDNDRHGHPADGVVCTHAASKLPGAERSGGPGPASP